MSVGSGMDPSAPVKTDPRSNSGQKVVKRSNGHSVKLTRQTESNGVKRSQTGSNGVKRSQTESNVSHDGGSPLRSSSLTHSLTIQKGAPLLSSPLACPPLPSFTLSSHSPSTLHSLLLIFLVLCISVSICIRMSTPSISSHTPFKPDTVYVQFTVSTAMSDHHLCTTNVIWIPKVLLDGADEKLRSLLIKDKANKSLLKRKVSI